VASPVYYVLDSSEYWIVASNRFSEAPRQMTLRRVENDHYMRALSAPRAPRTTPVRRHHRILTTVRWALHQRTICAHG
jgi:hypothetical protein